MRACMVHADVRASSGPGARCEEDAGPSEEEEESRHHR